MYEQLKLKVHDLVEVGPAADGRGGHRFDWFDITIIALILLNVAAVIFDSVPSIHARWGRWLDRFEVLSLVVFTIEYLLRVWSCTVDPRYRHPVAGRLRFMVTLLALVDLLAIAPVFFGLDMMFMRSLRLFRMLRVLKLGRYSESLATFAAVLRAKREELAVAAMVVVVLLICAASLLYYVENDANGQVFSSIPQAMWWAVVTLTTVGYGDIYPITPFGKLLGGIIALLGIGLFALPAGILAAGFTEHLKSRRIPHCCPHCGRDLDAAPEPLAAASDAANR